MNKGILELASYLNISDEEIIISFNGTDISSTLGLSYYLPYNKVYTMENITGSFSSYTYIKKQTDNKLYLSSNLTDWYLIGVDGIITTSGGCTILVRTFDFIDSNLKTNGINALSNEYPNINSSITVTGNYTTTSNIKTVNVNASTATITLDNIFITNSITIRKISAYDGNAVTIIPPSGMTFEGETYINLYSGNSFVTLERLSETLFTIVSYRESRNNTGYVYYGAAGDGILVTTNIVSRIGLMPYLEITTHNYGNGNPSKSIVQCYPYQPENSILQSKYTSLGGNPPTSCNIFYDSNGRLCWWFPKLGNYTSYNFLLYTNYQKTNDLILDTIILTVESTPLPSIREWDVTVTPV